MNTGDIFQSLFDGTQILSHVNECYVSLISKKKGLVIKQIGKMKQIRMNHPKTQWFNNILLFLAVSVHQEFRKGLAGQSLGFLM